MVKDRLMKTKINHLIKETKPLNDLDYMTSILLYSNSIIYM